MQQDADKSNAPAPDDALRRRLLKASAAAPLVATLTPNSALALSSAIAACSRGDFSNKKFADNGNSINGDTAIRVPVTYWQKKSGGGNPTGWDNKLYEIDGGLYGQSGAENHPTTAELEAYYEKDTAYVLELYDISSGQPSAVGLWPKVQESGLSATPITGSCWTSLTGTPYPIGN